MKYLLPIIISVSISLSGCGAYFAKDWVITTPNTKASKDDKGNMSIDAKIIPTDIILK